MDTDRLLLAALRHRDARWAGVPRGSVLEDCRRAFHSAVAARRRADDLERRLSGARGTHAASSSAAGSESGSITPSMASDALGGSAAPAEVARLKDRVIALQEKVNNYMETRALALERASNAEDRARTAERRAEGLAAELATAQTRAAAAAEEATRHDEEGEILRGEVQALRDRALTAESAGGRARAELESLLTRFVREKADAAAQINALTEELRDARVAGAGGGAGAGAGAGGVGLGIESAAEAAGREAVEDDVALMAALVGPRGSDGATDAPKSLVRRDKSAHEGQVSAACYSPNGSLCMTAGVDGVVKLWDGVTFRRKAELRASTSDASSHVGSAAAATLLCLDAFADSVVAGSLDKIVRCWDVSTGSLTHQLGGHSGRVLAVCAIADGRAVLSAGADRTLRLWDLRAHRAVRTIPTVSVPQCADVTGDGSYAVAGHLNKSLRIFDLTRGTVVAEVGGAHPKPIMSVSYSRGDASARVLSFGQDGSWRILGGATLGAPQQSIVPSVAQAAAARDGDASPSSGGGGGILGWFSRHRASGSAGQADAAAAAAGAGAGAGATPTSPSAAGAVGSGSRTSRTLSGSADPSSLVSRDGFRPWSKRGQASLSPSGRGGGFVAATGEDGSIGIWDAAQASWVRALTGGHPSATTALAWSPDGRRLVSADADGGVAMWH